jgi:phosphoribosylaminoimidazolecarboxamide formyltransferase/IMP cyclohydrolase
MKVERALISVYRKDGVVDLCRRLHGAGVEILSTGGTARLLQAAGVPVLPVESVTGFPEMMDGRVKTLHPRVHGGILARRDDPAHRRQMEEHGIRPIDLVVVNLYPFAEVAGHPGAGHAEAIEMIDIGGPAMIRSAAKNHAYVGVVVDPADYEAVGAEIAETGGLSEATRRRLAAAAFRCTSRYDDAIGSYLAPGGGEAGPPERFRLDLDRAFVLRYGENPHQRAAFYREPGDPAGTIAGAELLQGKALSFNNLLDLDAAHALAGEFEAPAAALIKHTNPCGCAVGATLLEAFQRARETDPLSAFGGIVALNREVDGGCAAAILEGFVEAIVAPGFTAEALEAFRPKKALRVLRAAAPAAGAGGWDLRRIRGGLLVQDADREPEGVEWKVPTRRPPTPEERRALEFAWKVVRHVKSNAVVFTAEGRTLGIGAGQMSRIDSVNLARSKARLPLRGSVVGSDAFFPFRDGIDAAAEAGATAVIQPGGSVRDAEVIAAADDHGLAMVFTGVRHFRH